MIAQIIDGKKIAAEIFKDLNIKITNLKKNYNIIPGLAVILVGDNHASQIYIRKKIEKCKELNMLSFSFNMPSNTSEHTLINKISSLNNDPKVHGILLQLPLPEHIDPNKVINSIIPHKDVDGLHPDNLGRLLTDQDGIIPCTPQACVDLIKKIINNLSGKKSVIIGRSNIVGKPTACLLLKENSTITICHSKTEDIKNITKDADILVCAIGKSGIIDSSYVKKDAIVIDVGINRVKRLDGTEYICGDIDFESVKNVAYALTPVPGGVGPMTIAYLMKNALKTACMTRNISINSLD